MSSESSVTRLIDKPTGREIIVKICQDDKPCEERAGPKYDKRNRLLVPEQNGNPRMGHSATAWLKVELDKYIVLHVYVRGHCDIAIMIDGIFRKGLYAVGSKKRDADGMYIQQHLIIKTVFRKKEESVATAKLGVRKVPTPLAQGTNATMWPTLGQIEVFQYLPGATIAHGARSHGYPGFMDFELWSDAPPSGNPAMMVQPDRYIHPEFVEFVPEEELDELRGETSNITGSRGILFRRVSLLLRSPETLDAFPNARLRLEPLRDAGNAEPIRHHTGEDARMRPAVHEGALFID